MNFKYLIVLLFLLSFSTITSGQIIEDEVMAEPPPPPPPPVLEVSPNSTPKSAFHGQQNGRYGYYTGNKWVIPPIYDELDRDFSDFMRAKKKDKYGIIDRHNNIIVPFDYDKMIPIFKKFTNWRDREWTGLYNVVKNDLKGIMDKKGSVRIPVKYTTVYRLKENLYTVGSEELGFGLVNLDHEILLPFDYDTSIGFRDKEQKILVTKKEGKLGWINQDGKIILPFEYEELKKIGYPASSHYNFKKEGKWGFMGLDGKIIVPAKYDWIEKEYGDITIIANNNKFGILGPNFKEIIPPTFASVERISMLFLKVAVGNNSGRQYGLIDTLGKVILDTIYHSSLVSGAGNLIFAKEKTKGRVSKFAIFDRNGKQIVPPTYTFAKTKRDFYSVAISGNNRYKEKALMNDQGKVITPFIYERFDTKNKRGSKDEYVIHAVREDGKVTINPDGSENNNFKAMNSKKRQADTASKTKQNQQLIASQIKGEWYGISKDGYLVSINFLNAESAVRTIYYLKEGEECAVQHVVGTKIIPSMGMIRVNPLSRYTEMRCDKPSPNFLTLKDKLILSANLHFKVGNNKQITLVDYSKKDSPTIKLDNYDLLKKIKKFKQLEKELANKVESKPGGIHNPTFEISTSTNEVWINSYTKKQFGTVVEINGDFIFKPLKWATPTMTYSLSGVLKNIRYIDANGKVKKGDLDIGFSAFDKEPFHFKE